MSDEPIEGELITLERVHPDFNKYIMGSFSKSLRALPLTSLNVNTDQEKITFEVVDVKSIQTPSRVIKWMQILKVRNFIWVLLPLFLILIKNYLDETLGDPILAATSALGALFLHAAMNLTNDIQDHVRGLDRIYPDSGSRALQKGWVTAQNLKRFSYFFIGAGVLFSLPVIFVFPEILILVVPLSLLGGLGLASYKMGLKYRAWSELVIFLMLGPLLTLGYQYSFGGGFDIEAAIIGLLCGWLAVLVLHLKNLDDLIVGSQAEFNNTVARLGFDSSKKLITRWWSVFVVSFIFYHGIYLPEFWMWLDAVFLLAVSFRFLVAFREADSPVGSKIKLAINIAKKSVQLTIALWVFENLVYYIVVEYL